VCTTASKLIILGRIYTFKISGIEKGGSSDRPLPTPLIFTGLELKHDRILLSVIFEVKKEIPSTQLINGSLLCFSSDSFKTILFTIVANRDHISLNKILVKIESDLIA